MTLNIDSFEIQNIDTTICQGESLTVNGVTYTANGFYQDTARYTASGCDSIQYNVTLNIDSFIVENIDTTICQGESLTVNGVTYTVNGFYQDTARYTVSGCDSIQYNVTLNIDSFEIQNIDTTICQGESLTVNGVTYTSNGFYQDTARYTASGCDSIQYNVTLNIDSFTVENIDTTICQGNSLTVNGVTYTSNGFYQDTARYTASGCDSIQYNVTLNIDSFEIQNIDTTICQGESLTVNGVTYTANGFYQDTARYTASGCDSIQYNVTLNIDSFTVENIDTTICQGESLTVNGVTYTSNGFYQDTARYTVSGCDSIQYNVTLNIDSFIVENIDTTICYGQTLTVNNVVYNSTGFYQDTLSFTSSGCDSIQFNIVLVVDTLVPVVIDTSICDGQSVIINNNTYTPGVGFTTFNETGFDFNGCIRDTTINITVHPTYDQNETITICEDESYTLPNGNQVNTAGEYTSVLQTINGCDSIINTTLNVNFLLSYTPLEDIRVCSGLGVELITNAQNTTNIEWFVLINGVEQSLVGNPNYTNTTSDGLGFNLDTALHENIYIIEMTDECGNVTRDSMLLEVFTPRAVENGVEDTTFCLHEIDIITVDYNGTNYEWNNGTLGASVLPDEPGEYIVNFVENYTNCLLSDTINVEFEDCIGNCVVLAPTGFSPNGDGSNDEFRAVTSCDEGFSYFEMRVFNRWGELVYATDDWTKGWDGTYKGREAEIGAYIYYVEYTKNVSNEEGSLKGNVTLIR